ncbi:MAG TPA: ABC transporter ATP-binding protein [Selenomonadales bacterium]|nr:ABC transporter ATP-binding protein [Selenomonadales bacterium]
MLRKFATFYRKYRWLFALDFGCAFLMSGLNLVFPLVVKYILDAVVPSGDLIWLVYTCLGLLALYLVHFVLDYIVTYWGHVLGIRIEYDMRKDLFEHIHKLSFTYFDNTRTGHLLSRLVNDLNEIAELAHHGPEDFFIATITLTGSFAILFTMNWKLACLMLVLVPAMLWFAIIRNRDMQLAFRDLRVKIADINAQAEDSISGVRVVKAFANEEYEQQKFDIGNSEFLLSRQQAYGVMARFYPGVHLFANMFQLIVLFGGGFFLARGELSIGELVSFFLYVAIFLQPIRQITTLVEQYQKGMAGFSRFVEIMEICPDIQDEPNAVHVGKLKGDIVFSKVTFSYNQQKNVLRDLDLEIIPGETVALVGPSGGGKTTLCSLIPRFYEVDQGQILIDGKDIRRMTQRSLRENIGIVQQDVFLFSESVRNNIAYGRVGASEDEIIEAAKKANAHEFIMELEKGYDTLIGERGIKLSGGQKQRLAIARVFLKDPAILILDEATSALDNETEQIIQDALASLAKDRTTLIIAHRLATLRFADRIIVLTDAGIAETGTQEELLRRDGVYARLYAAQFEGNLPEE